MFEKLKDCASELGDKNEMTSFVLGFKLGMRLAVEAMISVLTKSQNPKWIKSQ